MHLNGEPQQQKFFIFYFFFIPGLTAPEANSQRVEGRCYYNEMVREKFILIGKKGVLGVNLNLRWAPTLQGIATKKFKIKIFSIIFYHF